LFFYFYFFLFKKTVQSEEISKEEKKKDLKRSKSESKSTRRRFFSRNKTEKPRPRKTSSVEELRPSNQKLPRKSQSFHEKPTLSALSPPPPAYEPPTTTTTTSLDIAPLPPTTVTWKNEHEFYPVIDLDRTLNGIDDDDDDGDEESVPLLVTVFVIPLYLTLGAILFSIWEGWSFLDSFYFCFITVTTIGFGDLVPGTALKVAAENEKLISAAAYILFGLVLIAMCVNLMKEQLSQKVKRVANKLGSF